MAYSGPFEPVVGRAASDVLLIRHDVEVSGVRARPVPAQVVEVHALGYRPVGRLVRDTVRPHVESTDPHGPVSVVTWPRALGDHARTFERRQCLHELAGPLKTARDVTVQVDPLKVRPAKAVSPVLAFASVERAFRGERAKPARPAHARLGGLRGRAALAAWASHALHEPRTLRVARTAKRGLLGRVRALAALTAPRSGPRRAGATKPGLRPSRRTATCARLSRTGLGQGRLHGGCG